MANLPQKRKSNYSADNDGAPVTSKQYIAANNRSLPKSSVNSAPKQSAVVVNYAFEILNQYQNKRYDEALILIEQFKKLPPNHPQYRKEEARTEFKIIEATILAETNRLEEANAILQAVLEKNPNNSFALYAKGVMLYNNGDFRGSVEPFDKAIEINPSTMRRAMEYRAKASTLIELVNLANEQYGMNQFTIMIDALRMALLVDPTNTKICETVTSIREFLISQVIRRLEVFVLGKKPERYTTVEKLITEYKLKEASFLIKEIASEVPRTAEGAFLVGFYNYMRGEIHDACKHFVEAICLDDTCDKYKEYYIKANDTQLRLMDIARRWSHQDFLNALQQASLPEIDPKNLVVKQLTHFNRGNALLNLDRPSEAREEFVKYREIAVQVGIDVMETVLSSHQASAEGDQKSVRTQKKN